MQRTFDFLELLAHGSYTVATQRLKERFRCMLTPEALCVEFSKLRFKPHRQTIQEFATEVEQIYIRTFPQSLLLSEMPSVATSSELGWEMTGLTYC